MSTDPARAAGAETLAVEFERLAGALSSERWVGFDNEEGPELATGRTVHGEYVGLVPNCDPAGDGDARDGFNADAAFAAFAANNRDAILAALRDGAQREQLRLMRDDFAGLLAWQRSRPEGMTFENRLTGIPVAATAIVTVLDCLDNMLSGRDYNDEWAAEERHKNG